MNSLRNSARLIGHLGDNPKMTKLSPEKSVANFSVATNENFRDHDGNKKSETTWHKIVAWGKQAEFAEKYLKKGSEIAIEGKMTNRSYDDKNGETHYISEIIANDILILDKKAEN
jgi:single-strand DNA-binding protein